jgi:hypothetical protein
MLQGHLHVCEWLVDEQGQDVCQVPPRLPIPFPLRQRPRFVLRQRPRFVLRRDRKLAGQLIRL